MSSWFLFRRRKGCLFRLPARREHYDSRGGRAATPRAAVCALAVALALPAAGRQAEALPAAPRVPPPAVPMPRLTLRLDRLPLPEAAERLSAALGKPVRFGPYLPGTAPPAGSGARPLLEWRSAPLGAALREFCRAYRCQIQKAGPYGRDGIWLRPVPFLPPERAFDLGGFTLLARQVALTDSWRRNERGEESRQRRLRVTIGIRSSTGDATPVHGLASVTARAVNGPEVAAEKSPFIDGIDRAFPTPFPDEREQVLEFAWNNTPPASLRLTGELLLYRRIMLREQGIDLGQEVLGPQRLFPRETGPRLLLLERLPTGVTVSLMFPVPPGERVTDLFADLPARLRLADGSSTPVRLTATGQSFLGRSTTERARLIVLNLPSPPVRLEWTLITRAEPERRLPFVLELPTGLVAAPKPIPGGQR